MADINAKINIRGAVDDWAKFAIIRLQKSLKKHKIGVTGSLHDSFQKEIEQSGGDVKAVMIKFHMYGRFRDMGVGWGLKAYERTMNTSNLKAARAYGADVSSVGRQPKRWFNKPKMAQIYRLREILAVHLSGEVTNNVAASMKESTEYKIRL